MTALRYTELIVGFEFVEMVFENVECSSSVFVLVLQTGDLAAKELVSTCFDPYDKHLKSKGKSFKP